MDECWMEIGRYRQNIDMNNSKQIEVIYPFIQYIFVELSTMSQTLFWVL